MSIEKTIANIRELKPNGFVMLDGVPCRVEKVQVATSGKHGHAKVRVEGVGLLDNTRRSLIAPAHENVDVPIVLRKKSQVLSVSGNRAQLMDLQDYSTIELDVPEERKSQIVPGTEVEYFEVCDVKTLKELK